MHIIKPQQAQTIRFIPRITSVSPNYKIVDQSENKDVTSDVLSASGTYSNGIVTFIINFKDGNYPVEGRFYTFEAYNSSSGEVHYKGTLFCTAQTEYDKYTVNQNVYTQEESYNNEFILLWVTSDL